MDYKVMAKNILEKIGGADNVRNVTHCATRLRLTLHDTAKADDQAVENIDGVINVINKLGQHAGFPAGNSTACQVQLAITASAVTSAAMCRNFFCSGLGAFCCVQGLILRAQWGQKDAPSGRGTLQSGQRFYFSGVILDSFIFKMPPSDEERFYTAWRG